MVAGIETVNDGRELMQYLMRRDRDEVIRYRGLPTRLGAYPTPAPTSSPDCLNAGTVHSSVPNSMLSALLSTKSKTYKSMWSASKTLEVPSS